jgi:hypothetical protein
LATIGTNKISTLWASGYEIYDRISEPYQKFLETLTATFAQPGFIEAAKRGGFELYEKSRGAPENVGSELKAIHPVIRTNPVTGWKSVFPVGGHVQHINGLTKEESKALLDWFVDLVYKNHDLTVRFKWKTLNDIGKFIMSMERPQDGSRADTDNLFQQSGTIAAPFTPLRSIMTTKAHDLGTEQLALARDLIWTQKAFPGAQHLDSPMLLSYETDSIM